MKPSVNQIKRFCRIQRKHNVSVEFILRNMSNILKFIQYAITPHVVLKRKLIRRRNRVFIRYNHLRKLIFDPALIKKKQRIKHLHSQWSKRVVMHLRRYKTVEFVEDEVMPEAKLPEKEVSKQLKEQLELLKSGKRNVPLFEETDNTEQHKLNASTFSEKQNTLAVPECSSIGQCNEKHTEEMARENVPEVDSTPPIAESIRREDHSGNVVVPNGVKSNRNFLDMLISKVKNTTDDVGEAEVFSIVSIKPPKKAVKHDATQIIEIDEQENSNSSSDFFGFEDNERILGTTPGMLSTPLVQKRDLNSAFESETLNAFMRDNSLELTTTVIDYPKERPEDGLMSANAIPPKLEMPAVPEGLQNLRTVAERRAFLQKNRNIKYCLINNVGTVYRELQKRIKGHKINRHAIETLVHGSNATPLTRQGWKAAAWLLTDEGNYYFQSMNVDGKTIRLYGCRGNNTTKFKEPPHISKCDNTSSLVCTEDCMDRLTFRLLRPIRTIERRSKLSDESQRITYKACPLSQKILQRSRDDGTDLGSLEIMRMPHVELEVYPQLEKPLNDIAKRYLQFILPYKGISRNWAEFSVSTLIASNKQDMIADSSLLNTPKSFTFKLPYANEREHVLVRRVYSRSEAFEGGFEKSDLSFRKEIDQKKARSEPVDLLAEECADVLTDMLNSVAISCSENSFIKDDPDNIYVCGSNDEEIMVGKSTKKTVELHQHIAGPQNKKQSRMLMELRRLNATIIDAATSKKEEDELTCEKEPCRLGCVCGSLNEGTTVRQHCGKQKCILGCDCKCPGIMRLETDGRSITTEDAFMLRRQATAKLARIEKEFTSTIVLTGSETLLINESQYDKKRRCTKVPKRYGDFVDPDDSDFNDSKSSKKVDILADIKLPPEPVMVKEQIYQRLKHCRVKVKRLRNTKDLALWCMVHMVYKCFCKGQATIGAPIVLEKQEENTTTVNVDDACPGIKSRTLYSFEKEESKANNEVLSSCGSDSGSECDVSGSHSSTPQVIKPKRGRPKEKRGRLPDSNIIESYMNAKTSRCRRVIPIPRNTYLRRNRKRVALVQMYITEHETDQTRLNLNEHVLRSVYYHKSNPNAVKRIKTDVQPIQTNQNTDENLCLKKEQTSGTDLPEKRKICDDEIPIGSSLPKRKKKNLNISDVDQGESLLRINRYKSLKKRETSLDRSLSSTPSNEQVTVPKIAQIFSLNSQQLVEMGTDTAAAAAANISQQSTEATATDDGTHKALKNVFQVVIKNMNNLVSKKMQDIDMALRRESKAIPAPNDEILCIIRWNNFLEAYNYGYLFLWEVRTTITTFIAATIRKIMPLVVNALSVVNIRAISRENLPLLGKMLVDEVSNTITDGLAVVMQGQKLYWNVKGFLRPDKSRICPKPTPETHPLLTKKINILCQLLINQQINEHKKRQEATVQVPTTQSPQCQQRAETASIRDCRSITMHKLKILPMQRNISDHATKVLEQMVTQAYGMVRTNISFRKLLQHEIKEIYPPATIVSDHHWLVLDLSNDFSHIFIPELKDLLTLDRIQKVMTYAMTKGRFVKMQFSSKTTFNAFVTPMSRRKLYFGPFHEAVPIPKLILLQSVDGQMMLREVYEQKHNITARTDKTTGFWLIQKRGKLVLDIETKSFVLDRHGMANQIDEIEEILDDDEVSFVQHEPAPPCQEQTKNDSQTSIQSSGLLEDNDDDCVIIEDECDPSSSTVTHHERMNYTITNENSKLVVTPDQTESSSNASQNGVGDTFVILSNDEPAPDPVRVNDGVPNITQTMAASDANSDVIIQEATSHPVRCQIETEIHTIHPTATRSDNPITHSPTPLNTNSINSPEVNKVTTEEQNSGIKERNKAELAAPKNDTQIKDSSPKQQSPTSIKWNKNITIKKLLTPTSDAAPVNAKQTVTPVLTSPPPLTMLKKLPNQVPCANPNSQQVIKSVVGKSAAIRAKQPQLLNQQQQQLVPVKTTSFHMVSQQHSRPYTTQPRPVCPETNKTSPTAGQQLTTGSQNTGLIVRTPTAINSCIKNRSLLVGNTLLNPNIPMGTKVKAKTVFSPPPTSVPKTIVYTSTAKKVSSSPTTTQSVFTVSSPKIVHQAQLRKVLAKPVPLVGEDQMRAKIQRSPGKLNSQTINASDPLHISEETANNTLNKVNNLPQSKLINDVKTLRIVPKNPELRATITTNQQSDTNGSAIKRNYVATYVNRARQQTQPLKTGTATVLTTVTSSGNSLIPQGTQIKGIPVDVPPIKKYGIMHSTNTTVITPPSSKGSGMIRSKTDESQSAATSSDTPLSSPKIRKIVTNTSIQPGVFQTQVRSSLLKANSAETIEKSATGTFNMRVVQTSNTEYGYFHANREGLPKFVVKRVNDDYLIKVPNFNGILKLTGLSTVHNYLNQYIIQRCGITAEDASGLRWTFRAQDRSKFNNVSRSIPPVNKTGPIIQKVFPVKRVIQQAPPPPKTSPIKATMITKPVAKDTKATESKEEVIFLDDN